MRYTEPEVDDQNGLGLGEDLARAVRKLIKIFSIEETCLDEDLAELSRKMKIMRKQDESLLDNDDITAQISTARPVGCKSKRALQGECCCQEHCKLTMHFSDQVRLTTSKPWRGGRWSRLSLRIRSRGTVEQGFSKE